MSAISPTRLPNGGALPLRELPCLPFTDFADRLQEATSGDGQLCALFGLPSPRSGLRLIAVTADRAAGRLAVMATDVEGRWPSLTPRIPQAHGFEREIAEQWGVTPDGHPWLKPLRHHAPFDQAAGPGARRGETRFFSMAGAAVHEVAVGPIHAGVIEPGHFRFQCHGETIHHLEIKLGYQHRGIEQALIGGPDKRTLHLLETLAGDTTVGHTLAYCELVEGLTGVVPSARAQALRAVALELERMANHVGDLGALAGDVGYLPTASFCGRLRGDVLNLTALLCGNRFSRGLIRPGGVRFDLNGTLINRALEQLENLMRDLDSSVALLWQTSSVRARFEGTGVLATDTARALGMAGPAARASGLAGDARHDFPSGIYKLDAPPMAAESTGDVLARARLRWQEIRHSAAFVARHLMAGHRDDPPGQPRPLPPEMLAVALTEGWRGRICHVALTDAAGRFARYKVVDPSFFNWSGVAIALRGQPISDFPLCNKSFNLSYCGHDL